MPMQAVGGYIRVLREQEGLSQEVAATQAGVVPKTLSRWENGRNEPPLTALKPLIKLIRGSLDQVQSLLLDDEATVDDGAALARRWIRERTLERFEAEARTMTTRELRAAIAEFEAEVNYDEEILSAWRAFVAVWRKARPRPVDARRKRNYRSGQRGPRPPEEPPTE